MEELPESEWNQIERDAKIYFKEHIIDYPIEFSIKQIANFNADFLNASGKEKENLSEWFKAKFGKTLAEEYLIPYNRKIWGLEPNSINIGNFIKPNRNYTITESIGIKSLEEIVKHGNRIPYLKKLIDYNVSDYAYVIYDHNYQKSVSQIKNYLSHEGLYSIGRFGEWEYYNMDICIESAMKLSNLISCNNKHIPK